jgi:hypothetical protein
MKKYKTYFVIGIIILFVGVSVTPNLMVRNVKANSPSYIRYDDFEDYYIGESPKESNGWSTVNVGGNNLIEAREDPLDPSNMVMLIHSGGSAPGCALMMYDFAAAGEYLIHYRIYTPQLSMSKTVYEAYLEYPTSLVEIHRRTGQIRWGGTGCGFVEFSPPIDPYTSKWVDVEVRVTLDEFRVWYDNSIDALGGYCNSPVNGVDSWSIHPYPYSVQDFYIDDFWIVGINQPPVADAGGPYVADEGSALIFNASGSYDPDGDELQYRWDFDNNGVWDIGWSSDPTASYIWSDDHSGTVKLEVSDGELTDTDTATVNINNIAPSITSLTLSIDPLEIDTEVNLTANFTDPGTLDTHTATIDWDDGNITTGTITGSDGVYTVTDSWAYKQTGVYTIILTVEDDDGGNDTESYKYVVVYNPDGGFVTGGGWIMSPEGAYTPDPDLTGKAIFGFSAEYKKGESIPRGKTRFIFTVANLKFFSEEYRWLVVTNTKAMFKGNGTINNEGNYGFLISAIDEENTPSTDVDLFRIKIWNKDNDDEVIYDNMLDKDEDEDPATEIGGGNIKIHKE